ncbi:MAG: DUF2948 family protein [Bdellovibrionales bacterium]
MDRLKLKAIDLEDLSVMSACLQDAAVQSSDIIWQPSGKRFGFIGQRYRWEDKTARTRINCRFWIDGVNAVQHRAADAAAALDLLAITPDDTSLLLHFAGGEAIKLSTGGNWRAYLEDFGPQWPCDKCPEHR